MTTTPRSTAALFICTLLASAALLTGDLMAVAPAAPTNSSVQFTRIGYPGNDRNLLPVADYPRPVGGYPADAFPYFSWLLRWSDNAVDEEGYEIRMRFGNSGSYYPMARLGPNNTELVISTGIPQTESGVRLEYETQFQIIAWKHNGTATESSILNHNTRVPNTAAAVTFGSPNQVAASIFEGGPTPAPSDGLVQLIWSENSDSELFYLLEFGEVPPGATPVVYSPIGFVNFNTTSIILSNQTLIVGTDPPQRLQLVPGKTYRFGVKATRLNSLSSGVQTGRTESAPLTIPQLLKPTTLSASLPAENTVTLRWTDRSHNETGYEIQSRPITGGTPPAFTVLKTVGANVSQTSVTLSQSSTTEFRVRALFSYRPTGAAVDTILYSEFADNTVEVSTTTFAPPSNLTATTSGVASTIDLTWQDNTTSEVGFNIYCRVAGTTGTFNFCRATAQNVNHLGVNSFTTSNTANGVPAFTPLAVGAAYEFVVRAVGENEAVFSADSSPASATAGEGFISRLYQPIKQGVAFNHTPTTSNPGNLTTMTATGLPPGLSINTSTGQITGTPTQAGVFPTVLTATFSSGPAVSATLMLRVESSPATPTVSQAIPSLTVGINEPFLIPLAGKFADADSELAARLVTTKGNIDLLLYPSLAPQAVTNFLNHLLGGDYNNMVFHRHAAGFVIQGGSIHADLTINNLFNIQNRFPSPLNEPGISNLRGTIAAAKTGARPSIATLTDNTQVERDDSFGYASNPDSATTDFFISLADNSFNLDNQNGGFTVYARVAGYDTTPGSGHPAVNAIRALPVANYGAPLDSLPVDAAPVPATLAALNVANTVRVLQSGLIAPLSYTLDAVSPTIAIATVTVEGNDLRIVGLTAGTRVVNVTATDLDGKTVTQPFTITVTPGHKAPAITAHPTGLTVTTGSPATFKVTATGTAPITYQWRHDGTPISGKTQATLDLTNVQAADTGLYDVVVTNATTTLTSNPARLSTRTVPDITGSLPHRLITAGTPLVLEATLASGAPDPSFVWKRGTTTVTGQTTKKLNITAAKLTDAGIYKATATNTAGSDTTTSATVCIVDAADTVQVTKPGATVKLTAPAAGPDMTYQWRKNGADITVGTARFSGMQSSVLTITSADLILDSADYTCRITAPLGLGPAITGKIHLAVSNKPSLNNFTLADGYIGAGYTNSIPYNKTDLNTAASFTVTGLPPGLKFNVISGLIEGVPTRAGTYTLRVTASNPAGSSTAVTGSLHIKPLGGSVPGSFLASVPPSTALNAGKGGRLDLTVTDTSAYTAKLQMGKDIFTSAGNFRLTNAGNFTLTNGQQVTLAIYSGSLSFARKNLPALSLNLQIIETAGSFSAVITDGASSINIEGFRTPWNSQFNPHPFNSYNVGLYLANADLAKPAVPQGDGYVRAVTTTAGVCNFTGKLADGTAFTASSILGENRQMVLFQMLNNNTGSILCSDFFQQVVRRADNNLYFHRADGSLRWIKDPQTAATERNYRAGIPETMLTMRGNIYSAPGANGIVGGLLNIADNAYLDFSEGGLATAARNPDKNFRLQTSHLGLFAEPNPAKVSLSVSPSTGIYTGTFELLDGSVTRRVSYQGLIIPKIEAVSALPATTDYSAQAAQAEVPLIGAGHFLLPELLPTATTSKLLSGKAKVLPAAAVTSVQITRTSLGSFITPGTAVTFSILANDGTGPFTYQWRKGTADIAGATSATYTLNAAAITDNGDYTVVVRKAGMVTGITSNLINLDVQNPITNVVVTRSPATGPLATASSVTFTVTADGVGPFSYQWIKGTSDQPGANSNTFTINPLATTDTGAYLCRVSNVGSQTGILSSQALIEVMDGVSNIAVTKSYTTQGVAVNTDVTFNVTADGGSLAYQWRKNGVAISGATSSSYTFNSGPTPVSAADYDVLVSNPVVPAGILSGANTVIVVQPITSVTASRTPSTPTVVALTDPVVFTATPDGSGPYTYVWHKDGTIISGANSSTYTLISPVEADDGTYTCIVTDLLEGPGVTSNGVALDVIPAP